jgi:tetratricopeptide (TPR) repeat protein
MELIRGHSLLDYAEQHQLNSRQRLELMVKICEAIQHAHQRGIVHRDLKPGNISVDEAGQPKILDFGVARVIDNNAHAMRNTDAGQFVGTLPYMSPEQVSADIRELDTRSDVYTLGVILYELLAGRPPYVLSPRTHQAAQTILNDDPTPLSSVNRSYRGDIETIVAKALEKDKTRRYASASALAADIERYLKDEPITARPSSASYHLRKFAARHKALVTGVIALLAVLIGGIIASTWEAARARRAEQAALRERDRADTEAATAAAIDEFLRNDLLAQASASAQARPDRNPDPDLKVRTVLDRAVDRITGKFGTQPLVEASIRQTLGNAYRDLGLYPEAQRQLERTLELLSRAMGQEQANTLATIQTLALLYQDQGKFAQAESLLLKVLGARRRVLGEDHPDTLDAMGALADVYQARGAYAQAEPLLTKVVDSQLRVLGEGNPNTLNSMGHLAVLYRFQGKYEQAEALYIKVMRLRQRILGEEHPDTLDTMSDLAVLYRVRGKYAQAEPLSSTVLRARRRILGEEHPDTLLSMNTHALIYQDQGRYAEAEPLFTQVLRARRHLLGPEHPNTLNSMSNLGTVYQNQGKYADAETLFTAVLELRRRVLGAAVPDTLISMNNLALLYTDRGKYSEAEPLLTNALAVWRRIQGEEHPEAVTVMGNLARLYRYQGRYAEAESLFTKVLTVRRRVLGEKHPRTLVTLNQLASLYLDQHRYAQAESLLREAMTGYDETAPDTWRRYSNQSLLGASLLLQKKYDAAESLLLSGYRGMLQRKATIPAFDRVEIEQSGKSIVKFYQDRGKPKQADEWQKKLEPLKP